MKASILKNLFLPGLAIILFTFNTFSSKAAVEAKFSTDAPQWQRNSVYFWDNSTSYPGYITQWEWDFGDGSNPVTNNLPDATHTFDLPGIYNTTLTVTDNLGEKASITQEVSIVSISLPIAKFWSNGAICESGQIDFLDLSQSPSGTNIISWSWNFGDPSSLGNNSSSMQNPVHLYARIGSYNVTLTITTNQNQFILPQLPISLVRHEIVILKRYILKISVLLLMDLSIFMFGILVMVTDKEYYIRIIPM